MANHLTPGMARFLELHRRMTGDLGRQPTNREMRDALGGIEAQTVSSYVLRLRNAGYQIDLSLAKRNSNAGSGPAILPPVFRPCSAAEAEVRRLRSLVERFAAWSRSGELLMNVGQKVVRDKLCEDADRELTQRPTEAA